MATLFQKPQHHNIVASCFLVLMLWLSQDPSLGDHHDHHFPHEINSPISNHSHDEHIVSETGNNQNSDNSQNPGNNQNPGGNNQIAVGAELVGSNQIVGSSQDRQTFNELSKQISEHRHDHHIPNETNSQIPGGKNEEQLTPNDLENQTPGGKTLERQLSLGAGIQIGGNSQERQTFNEVSKQIEEHRHDHHIPNETQSQLPGNIYHAERTTRKMEENQIASGKNQDQTPSVAENQMVKDQRSSSDLENQTGGSSQERQAFNELSKQIAEHRHDHHIPNETNSQIPGNIFHAERTPHDMENQISALDTQISAPPELISLIPDAAEATVAAGYFNTSSEAGLTIPTTAPGAGEPLTQATTAGTTGSSTVDIVKPMKIEITTSEVETGGGTTKNPLEALQNSLAFLGESLQQSPTKDTQSSEGGGNTVSKPVTVDNEYVMIKTVPVQVVSVGAIKDSTGIVGTPVEVATLEMATENGELSTVKEEVLMVGDGRYEWQEWSSWHCNCPAGSMSRVRDIAYSVPDVHLDPLQYNVLRFERKACSYDDCHCSKAAHECDRLELPCKEEAAHMCALKDLEFDQQRKRTDFWTDVHSGLKNLWHSMKILSPRKKEPKTRKKRQAAPGVR